MTEIEVVIKIPEEEYKIIKNFTGPMTWTEHLIKKGTLLPKGHWIKVGDRGFGWSDTVICKCSECNYQNEFMGKFDGKNLIVDMERVYNYCPNCGAEMEEIEK